MRHARRESQALVYVPFNEPEGNMFGTGEWSYDRISWRTDPRRYFTAWGEIYRLIKGSSTRTPASPAPTPASCTTEVRGFLESAVAAGTPARRDHLARADHARTRSASSVAKYRALERESGHPPARAPRQHQRVRAQLPLVGARAR